MSSSDPLKLFKVYQRLYNEFGPQHWWPGDTQFEVIVGAILTQNTNWTNVEKAIRNLRNERVLTPKAFQRIPQSKLASLIRPAGYFNVKARRLKNFIRFLFKEYRGSLEAMGAESMHDLRSKLLEVNGIGQETADSILLYAFQKPVFVIDAYTKRIFYRHKMLKTSDEYHHVQKMFMGNLKNNRKLFNEYHALIVRVGKEYCRPKPLCEHCPLYDLSYFPRLQKFA